MAGEISAAPGNIFGRFTNTDMDFPTIKDEKGNDLELSASTYYQLIYSPDRRVRRDAFLGFHDTYAAKKSTLSAMLSSQVKQHIFYARARHYGSSLEAALGGPNIPVDVYKNLVSTVNANLPRLHRYVAMRKKLMKLDEIHRYDLYVPMISVEQKEIKYADAVGTILKALRPLGEDYVGTLGRAFESRWIDVHPTKNKRAGAYCWGAYLTHPFLLLNYTGTMNDRSTIAHEMGHAMHSWYTVKHQPYPYGDYATFCAEVASTVNEVILAHYLLNQAESDVERLLILQQQIEGIRTTVFRQTMFAEFEMKIHEMAEAGQPLTGDTLCQVYGDLVKRYYGPEMVMDASAPAECLRIPHFYRNYYVFTYATSHCAATNIGRRIIDGEDGAVEGLMDFLSAGSSRYPLDVLKLAHVDMTTPKPIEDTMELFSQLLEKFETLYDKQQKS
jgi:oligoendopeptidase F